MNKHIYMVGIGGASMSGIAELLINYGYMVSGSDMALNENVKRLLDKGIKVNIGQKAENIDSDIDLLVYTGAISPENEEIVEAKRLGIKIMERGELLGLLTEKFKDTIGVAGTHGKTTTTSMVSCVFIAASKDPTIQVGSYLNNIDGNYRIGKSDYFIIESCEYRDSFLNFSQRSAIVTNIDNDHLDYFKNIDNISKSFQKYVSKLPKDGVLVVNMDNDRCYDLRNYTKAKVLSISTYNHKADYYAQNIKFDESGCASFDVIKNGVVQNRIILNVKGEHNISNALECFALCDWYGISPDIIKLGLREFNGASRRIEYIGKFLGAKVYDDYAHHPTEIYATGKAIVKEKHNEIYAIFEPHTYSRVANHKTDFAKALSVFNHIIIIDIYAAREKNIYNVSSNDIVDLLICEGKDAVHINEYEDIRDYLEKRVKENDIIITIGAGNVTNIAQKLVKESYE